MANVRILWNNLFDAATLSAYSAASGFPAANIQNSLYLKHWRSTGLSSEWVKGDLGSAGQVLAAILWYHNLEAGASLNIQAHASDAWTSPSLNEAITIATAQAASGNVVEFFSAAQTYEWWRLLMTDASNADAYLRLGRVFLGSYFAPSYDITTPVTPKDVDPSDILESAGGQRYVNLKTHYREITLKWDMLPDSDVETLQAIFAAVGKSVPFWICIDVDEEDGSGSHTYYVRFTDDLECTPVIHGWKSVTLKLRTER